MFKDRLNEAIDIKQISAYQLSKETGIPQATISNYRNRDAKPSTSNVKQIASVLGVSYEWLMVGIGEMTITKEGKDKFTPHYNDLKSKAIPHIDIVTASCGLPNGFNSAIMKEDCERYIIPDMPGCDFTIRAGGRSMINRNVPERSINDRDIIGCRIITTRSHIRWGEVYALATYDGIMIKKIEESNQEGCIRCIPFNEEEGFKPYDVPVNEIYDWALVVGVVSVKTWI